LYYACGILEFGDEFLKGGENVTPKKRREKKRKKKKRFVGPAMGKPGPTILHITPSALPLLPNQHFLFPVPFLLPPCSSIAAPFPL